MSKIVTSPSPSGLGPETWYGTVMRRMFATPQALKGRTGWNFSW